MRNPSVLRKRPISKVRNLRNLRSQQLHILSQLRKQRKLLTLHGRGQPKQTVTFYRLVPARQHTLQGADWFHRVWRQKPRRSGRAERAGCSRRPPPHLPYESAQTHESSVAVSHEAGSILPPPGFSQAAPQTPVVRDRPGEERHSPRPRTGDITPPKRVAGTAQPREVGEATPPHEVSGVPQPGASGVGGAGGSAPPNAHVRVPPGVSAAPITIPFGHSVTYHGAIPRAFHKDLLSQRRDCAH